MILQAEEDTEVVGAENGEAAVSLARRLCPDVVLMDVRMPVMNGLEAILATLPECRVIVLTTFDLDEYAYSAVAVGASGFLLKNVTAEQLVASIRLAMTGEALLAPSITRRLIQRFAGDRKPPAASQGALSTLPPRELEVLKLMARWLSNAELAKLGLRDRVQAVVLAYETGLVEPGA
jgi:DNA-binding NarL/FixJ family response regulator